MSLFSIFHEKKEIHIVIFTIIREINNEEKKKTKKKKAKKKKKTSGWIHKLFGRIACKILFFNFQATGRS